MHGFTPPDLFPPMRALPPYAALVACLDRLAAPDADVDFDPVWDCATPRDDIEAASAAAALRAQRRAGAIARYLGSIVGSDLAWLADDDERETVWTAASRCMAARCGRTAMGDITRRWPVDDVDIVLREPALVGDSLGFKTWGTAYVMARLLPELQKTCLHHLSHLFRRLPTLELGAGTGLLGLAAAVLWRADVLLTDLAAIVPNLAANVDRNADTVASRGGRARAAVLQWGGDRHNPEEVDPLFVDRPSFPLVLAADPLYDDAHVPLLADAIDTHLADDGLVHGLAHRGDPRAVVMVPLRDRHTERMAQAFVAAMAGRGLAVAAQGHTAGQDSDWGESSGTSSFVCAWWAFRRE